MTIFRIVIAKKPKGKPIGFKLVDAKSSSSIMNKPKSKYVGTGRYIVGVMPTKLKGTTKSRQSLPRSKRFGKSY